MSSVYPGAFDNIATDKTNATVQRGDHPAHHNDLADAVGKIEHELGTNPSLDSPTVAALLADLVVAAGWEDTSGFVQKSRMPFNVKDYGAVGDYPTTDDTAAIQAAIDACEAAGGGIVFVPPGTYKMTDELVRPLDTQVILEGAGEGATTLRWSSDLGAGKFALTWSGSWNGTRQYVRDMRFYGPSLSSVLGENPALMQGIKLHRNTSIERVNSRGFKSGATVVGDHVTINKCTLSGNYYSLYFGTRITAGNVEAINSNFEGATRASIGIAGDNGIEGGVYQGCHFGFGPFAFEKESITTNNIIMVGAVFLECAFEQIGNAVIEDADLAGWVYGCFFDGCAGSDGSEDYRLASAESDYQIHVGTINDLEINSNNRDQSFMSWKGDIGYFYCDDELRGLRWKGARTALGNAKDNATPLFAGQIAAGNNLLSTGENTYVLRKVKAGSVTAGDLLKPAFVYDAQLYSGSGSLPLGWAFQNAATDEIVPVQISGEVLAKCTTAIADNKWVKPDSGNNGKVAEATTFADGPIVGNVTTGAGVNSNVTVNARLGTGVVP